MSDQAAHLDTTQAAPAEDPSRTRDAIDVVVGQGPCSPAEAKELTARAVRALETFATTMQEIIRRRAWEALGYENPREYVLGEFTGGADSAGQTISRSHRYRLARLITFMYGLAQRLGDNVLAIDITERSLRAIPATESGPEDTRLIDEIETRLAAAGESADFDVTQQIVDEVLAEHSGRAAAAKTGDDPDDGFADPTDDGRASPPADVSWDAALHVGDYAATPEPSTSPNGHGQRTGTPQSTPGQPPAGVSSVSIPATVATNTATAASGALLAEANQFTALNRFLEGVAHFGPEEITNLLDGADDEELERLADLSRRVVAVLEKVTAAAYERAVGDF